MKETSKSINVLELLTVYDNTIEINKFIRRGPEGNSIGTQRKI
ncbi:hypothetical protein [uncultured Desulfobacter sp.]|nr:hypothetical protein [uncultured Desulfobacter sp.]